MLWSSHSPDVICIITSCIHPWRQVFFYSVFFHDVMYSSILLYVFVHDVRYSSILLYVFVHYVMYSLSLFSLRSFSITRSNISKPIYSCEFFIINHANISDTSIFGYYPIEAISVSERINFTPFLEEEEKSSR